VRRGDRVHAHRDGKPLGTSRLKAVAPMNLQYLLSIRSWANTFRGDLAEILVFDSALSDRARAAVEAYLGAKYGLSGFPDGPSRR
jgi:hypothetical protein